MSIIRDPDFTSEDFAMTHDSHAQSTDQATPPPASIVSRWLNAPWRGLTGVTFGAFLAVLGLKDVLTYKGFDTEPLASTLVGGLILAWLFAAVSAVIQWLCDKAGIPRRPTSRSWRLATGFSMALGFAFMLWGLSIPAAHNAQMAGRSQAPLSSQATGDWVERFVAGNQFAISTPAHWEPYPDPTLSNSVIRLWDRQNDLHLAISVNSRQDLSAATLTELSAQVINAAASLGTDMQVGELQLTEVGGRPAGDVVLTGTFDGTHLTLYFRHVEFPDSWVEIRQWTTRSKFEKHGETFARIAASLRRAG